MGRKKLCLTSGAEVKNLNFKSYPAQQFYSAKEIVRVTLKYPLYCTSALTNQWPCTDVDKKDALHFSRKKKKNYSRRT